MVSRAALPLLALLAACEARPLELSVDVRTDLAPGRDFASVRVELTPGQGRSLEAITREARPADRFWEGVRIADWAGLSRGANRVRATLLDAGGGEVLSRAVDLALSGDYALTIVLSADCVGRACPGASEPASYTECLSGECVDARCGGPSPEGCGAVSCETSLDCRLDCLAACIEGACVCAGTLDAGPVELDAGRDDAGPVDAGRDAGRDAGPCPGECAPGAMEEETRACGACAEGLERRARACGADCRWSAWGEFGACETSAVCMPGQTDRETRACGNCNLGTQSRTRSCDATTCTWGAWGSFGTCSGGGTCAPGATRAGSCDPCSHQVCSSSCTWGGCTLRSGNQCEHRSGTNWRCCGSGRWQFCLSSCVWSTDCVSCSGCGC